MSLYTSASFYPGKNMLWRSLASRKPRIDPVMLDPVQTSRSIVSDWILFIGSRLCLRTFDGVFGVGRALLKERHSSWEYAEADCKLFISMSFWNSFRCQHVGEFILKLCEMFFIEFPVVSTEYPRAFKADAICMIPFSIENSVKRKCRINAKYLCIFLHGLAVFIFSIHFIVQLHAGNSKQTQILNC